MVEDIGPRCAHKYPDYIIVNSGAHGSKKSLVEFAFKMQKLASWLGELQSKLGTKVIWRGNYGLGSLHAYETISSYYVKCRSISSLDVGTFLTAFEADLLTDCCIDKHNGNGLHVGVIGKYYPKKMERDTSLCVSSMVTQGIFDLMFREIPVACCLGTKV